MAERIAGQHVHLDAPLGADQDGLDPPPRLLQGLSQCEGGHEVAAGAAAREENSHRS